MATTLVIFCLLANLHLLPHSILNILLNFARKQKNTKMVHGHFGMRCMLPTLLLGSFDKTTKVNSFHWVKTFRREGALAIVLFTIMLLVTWPLPESDAGVDLLFVC